MDLKLRKPEECRYDALSLGEVMLRLDPGDGRIRTARTFRVWEGGGEYNVARGLRKCFGLRTGIITALADNEIGHLVEDCIMQGGVDTSLIRWAETDGIGRICRNGLNFTERGFGIRGSTGCVDRFNTAISKAKPEDFDFDYIFGELGARWLHTGGIYAALSEQSCETLLAAVRTAKKYGTVVSYDLNYRSTLWDAFGGLEKCREVNKEAAKYVDVMIGSKDDFASCLGLEAEESGDAGACENSSEKSVPAGCENMLRRAVTLYPNLKAAATTLPLMKSAGIIDWSALCFADGQLYKAAQYDGLTVYDRVGAGDAFASGLIYDLMTAGDAEKGVNYGAAHGALEMTTPGDNSMASKKEIEELMRSVGFVR